MLGLTTSAPVKSMVANVNKCRQNYTWEVAYSKCLHSMWFSYMSQTIRLPMHLLIIFTIFECCSMLLWIYRDQFFPCTWHFPDPSRGVENLSLQPQVFNISLRTLQKLKHRKPCLIPEIKSREKDDRSNHAINSKTHVWQEKLVHCFYNQWTTVKLTEAFVCTKLITLFNSFDATDDNGLKSLSVFLTIFGNMISSCHFEKSTLNEVPRRGGGTPLEEHDQ